MATLDPDSARPEDSDVKKDQPASELDNSPSEEEEDDHLQNKSRLRKLIATGALLVMAVTAFTVPSVREQLFGRDEYPQYASAIAVRGPFVVSVTENGELDSQSNVTLFSQVEGYTTIISIIREGTHVGPPIKSEIAGEVVAISPKQDNKQIVTVKGDDGQTVDHVVEFSEHTAIGVLLNNRVDAGDILAGDLVCELDSAVIVDEEKQQEILVTQSAAELEKARKDVEIQETQNASDIAAAVLVRDLAELDYENYEPGEFAQLQSTLEGDIALAKDTLLQTQETYAYTQRVSKKGYKSETELETARLAVARAENDVKDFEGQLRVLTDFTFVREMKARSEAVVEAEREISRVKLAGEATLAQFLADLGARELTHSLEVDKRMEMRQQIAACRMIAPQPGEIVYYAMRGRRGRSEVVIEEGASVYERQKIITLPDLSRLQVSASIHESNIRNIRVGLPVLIRVDAFPDTIYHGVIDMVSSIPSADSGGNREIKYYEAIIKLVENDNGFNDQLKPGLTASLEFIIEQREEPVLQIPVESVISVGTRQFVYVVQADGRPEQRLLTTGDSNATAVEVLDGIKEGEAVVLNPRSYFTDEVIELENQYGQTLEITPQLDIPEPPPAGAEASPPRRKKDAGGPGGGQGDRGKAGGKKKRNGNAPPGAAA